MIYTDPDMRELTVRLDEDTHARLSALAGERQASAEELARLLIEWELRRREAATAKAIAVLDEIEAREEPLSDDEATALAVAEIRLMRAERRARAAGRP